MGYIRRPSWYKDFQCIASACTDSCCCGWEIDIDEETFEFYNSVEGEFGERLRSRIAPANPENGEPAHFIQGKDERCPFLNERNLCDILLNVGEEHLSYICTHHPRFYEWFLDGREAGLGICCEEACRIMFQQKGRPVFEILEEDTEAGSEGDEPEGFEAAEEGTEAGSEGDEPESFEVAEEGTEVGSEDDEPESFETAEEDTLDALACDAFENFEPTEKGTEVGLKDDGPEYFDFEEEDREIEDFLFSLREELFDIINDHEKFPSLMDVFDALDRASVRMQVRFDDFLYPVADEEEIWPEMAAASDIDFAPDMASAPDIDFAPDMASAPGMASAPDMASESDTDFAPHMDFSTGMPAYSPSFFTGKQVADVCSFLKGLEINDMSWWGLLEKLRKKADEVLKARTSFDRYYGERQEAYRQLLNYFVYRYFMKAQDGDLSGRIGYAIMSVSVIYLLGVMQWLEEGYLTEKNQIDLCKLYSKEIEYDEENTQSFADYYCQIREI